MSVNGVTSATTSYTTATTAAPKEKEAVQETTTANAGVVYEPSTDAKDSKSNKVNDYTSVVASMKKELSNKNEHLQKLVDELLSKQAKKFTDFKSLSDLYKNLEVDEETVAQAKKDIADDGYWGVEQTSDRLVSMAQALSGGDPTKADELIGAIQKGFKQATKAWGDDLPDICQRTVDSAVKKMQDWRDGINTDNTTAE